MARKNLARNVGIVSIVIVGIFAVMLFADPATFTLLEDNLTGDIPFTLNRIVGETDVRGTTTTTTISIEEFNALDDGFDPLTQTNFAQGEINCKIKETVFELSRTDILRTLDSRGLQGSPFVIATLVTPSGDTVNGYNIHLKLFCTTVGELFGIGFNDQITAWITQVTYRAINADTGEVLATQDKGGSSVLRFGSGQGEQTFNEIGYLSALDVEDSLPLQDFNANIRIETIGNVNVAFSDRVDIPYSLGIFPNQLQVTFDTQVQRAVEQKETQTDSDGDGIIDSQDSCPTQPENFNGVDDGDGCPDQDPPITDPLPPELATTGLDCDFANGSPSGIRECKLACEEPTMSNTLTGSWIVQTSNIGGQTQTIYTCDRTIQPAQECPVGFVFSIATNDCVERIIAECPEGFIEVVNSEFPSGVCIPEDQFIPRTSVEEEVLNGQILVINTLTFEDGTREVSVARVGTSAISADLQANIGELVTGSVVGSGLEGSGKPISSIDVEVVYLFSPTGNPSGITLDSTFLRLTPTVVESTVSQSSGSFIQLRNADLGNSQTIAGAGGLSLGTGFSLGTASITSITLTNIGEDAGITEGQAKDADIILSIEGDIVIGGVSFTLTESTVTYQDFLINNSVQPVATITCTATQIEILDANGEVVGCRQATTTDSTCFTPERPSGFGCSPEFVQDNCPNGTSSCTEPDGDGDGVPDFKDRCRSLAEDGRSDGLAESDDGCPAPATSPDCPANTICTPPVPPKPIIDPPKLCSEQNPEACIVPPQDLPMILIIGGIMIVIIGVIIAVVLRRKPRAF